MNFSDFEYDESKIPSNVEERGQFFQELEKKFKDDILTNPRYQFYLNSYSEVSIESFASNYAFHKKELIYSFGLYKVQAEVTRDARYQHKAEQVFKLIAQKKLFNMQCLWRAEQIEIPEVKIAVHFRFWSDNIEQCPFLESVTHQELEVMKLFLTSNNYSDETQSWYNNWQDYNEIKSINEDGDFEMMPEWYDFYDVHMGTGYLLKLPDIRGDREEFYFEKNREKLRKEREHMPEQEYVAFKPYLSADQETIESFMKAFENKYFQTLHKGFTNMHDRGRYGTSQGELEEIEYAINLLAEADHPIYMPGGMNWKEAILKCAEQYINEIIANELDFVWESHKMLFDLGIRKGYTPEELDTDYQNDGFVKMLSEYILDGREYAGEPRNLDF